MKKILFIFFAFLILVLFSFSKDQCFSIEEAILAKNPPKISIDQKQWLLGLSAIIMEVNKCSHVTLEVKPISEKATKTYKSVLEKWWAINDRNELIDAIKRLEKKGHNEVYNKLSEILKSNPKHSVGYIYTMYKLNRKESNYYSFLKNTYFTINNSNIISWDIGRATSLVRWGYQVGYLTETEAWNLLLYFGRLIKTQYRSWEDYGGSYAYGRMFWASGFGKTEKYYLETKETLSILFSENGLWKQLQWNWGYTDIHWYFVSEIRRCLSTIKKEIKL